MQEKAVFKLRFQTGLHSSRPAVHVPSSTNRSGAHAPVPGSMFIINVKYHLGERSEQGHGPRKLSVSRAF